MATKQEAMAAYESSFDVTSNPEHKWWQNRIPSIHIPTEPYFLGNGAEHYNAVKPLFLELASLIEKASDNFKQPQTTVITERPYIVLSPVFAGSLPKEAGDALLAGLPLERLQQVLKNTLPEPHEDEPHWILSKRRVTQKESQWHFANVVNLVFIEDKDGVIEQLYKLEQTFNNTSSYEALLALHRHEIAKTGAYKTVLIPYAIKNERAEATFATIGTLEGGHPQVIIGDCTELTKRLLILGATNPVEPLKPLKNPPEIQSAQWLESNVVKGVLKFFRYSAKQGLVDPPVHLKHLINNQTQADKIGKLINWSQQQESAGLAYDPELGLWVVTGSGRYGLDKRQLKPEHLTPVWADQEQLVSGRVTGLNSPRPSIEAQEVLKAQIKLQQLFPRYTDSDGPISPIHSTLHLHRGEDTLNKMVKTHTENAKVQNSVLWLPPGRDDYDHIGCGMEEMDARTEDAMLRAYGEWEAANRKADFVLWYVANHGIMAAEFVKEDESFIPFGKIRRAIDKKHISITRSVLQV